MNKYKTFNNPKFGKYLLFINNSNKNIILDDKNVLYLIR